MTVRIAPGLSSVGLVRNYRTPNFASGLAIGLAVGVALDNLAIGFTLGLPSGWSLAPTKSRTRRIANSPRGQSDSSSQDSGPGEFGLWTFVLT